MAVVNILFLEFTSETQKTTETQAIRYQGEHGKAAQLDATWKVWLSEVKLSEVRQASCNMVPSGFSLFPSLANVQFTFADCVFYYNSTI